MTDFTIEERVYPYPRYAKDDTSRAGTIGGFSEYILIPNAKRNHSLYAVDDRISDKLASLIELFTVRCRATRRGMIPCGTRQYIIGQNAVVLDTKDLPPHSVHAEEVTQAKDGQEPTVMQFVRKKHRTAVLVDTGDVHVPMIGAAGVGKTAFGLYPCIEYACAAGMSFLSTDTKDDVMRNYGNIAKDYGYKVSVIDLRIPPAQTATIFCILSTSVWICMPSILTG